MSDLLDIVIDRLPRFMKFISSKYYNTTQALHSLRLYFYLALVVSSGQGTSRHIISILKHNFVRQL
jgi:hypothetical protein